MHIALQQHARGRWSEVFNLFKFGHIQKKKTEGETERDRETTIAYYPYSPTEHIFVQTFEQLQSPQTKTFPTRASSHPLFPRGTPILPQERHP